VCFVCAVQKTLADFIDHVVAAISLVVHAIMPEIAVVIAVLAAVS
jgi:hypothetical protein